MEIRDIITDLKNNTAPGEDQVTKSNIILLFDVIGETLVFLINKILRNENYPKELNVEKIIPVHKKGSNSNVIKFINKNFDFAAIWFSKTKQYTGYYGRPLRTH